MSVAVATAAATAGRAACLVAFAVSVVGMAWLARAPVPASYAVDVLPALVVLGASLTVAFVWLTRSAIAAVAPEERGLAAGLFETSTHLGGNAVAVPLLALGGFELAAGLAVVGLVVMCDVSSLYAKVRRTPTPKGHRA